MVTIEFVAGCVVVLIPLLVAVTEVYRVEQRARRMLFAAQRECIAEAVSRNSGAGRELSVEVAEDVALLQATRRIFPDWRPLSTRFEKTYYILTGSGRR